MTVQKKGSAGFTFVEVVVIAPIVILMIGAFIAAVVTMTASVLVSRAQNVLTYNVQDALNRIQQDVKLSTTFLAQSNVDLSSTKQGYDDATTIFNNVEPPNSPKGQMLILNALATTDNPVSNSARVAYLSSRPNACGASQAKNTPLTYDIIYYVKTVNGVSSLWRRTVMPSDYATTACNAIGSATPGIALPWQQPSCTPTTSGTFTNPFCKTNDQRLVDGVSINGFTVTYYARSSSSSANTVATTGSDPVTRQATLSSSTTVSVSIDAAQSVGGQIAEQTASIRATRLDTNASSINTTPPTTLYIPTGVTASSTALGAVSLSWNASGGTSYTVQYDTNNSFTNSPQLAPGITGTSTTITGLTTSNLYYFRVKAIAGSNTTDWSSTVSFSYSASQGLIGWWKLNGNASAVVGTNGVVVGATPTVGQNGQANSAYSFDGSSSHIDTSTDALSGDAAHTISLWLKPTSLTGACGRLDPITIGNATNNTYSAVDLTSGAVIWYFFNNDTNVGTPLALNQWSLLTLTYAGGGGTTTNKKIYINAAPQSANPQNANYGQLLNLPNPSQIGIGYDRGRTGCYYAGAIDDVRLYNRALSANEVLQIYQQGGL